MVLLNRFFCLKTDINNKSENTAKNTETEQTVNLSKIMNTNMFLQSLH